ncbi:MULTISPECIES: GNAT family N-acetyltransferase [Rhodomicrobium]|uniref:GNAT family N-acetyltransferase n=1 Tax=Rhodomicrobium TaxID=1068 RepID=UPI001FDA4A15|nr:MULTISPECIES: GNAT family N-acetyltransferase [Rhodomicrobium]
MLNTPAITKDKLVVRLARLSDVPAIARLSERTFVAPPWDYERAVRSQINNFPEGQFVAERGGEIVGHCATFIIDGDIALKPHSWDEITGDGMASRHDPNGDYLYGMGVCVDSRFRRLRIGQRLYSARRRLCEDYKLKGIVFGGRMPGYARRRAEYPTPEGYLEAVKEGRVRDSAIQFHLADDFETMGIIRNYDVSDQESRGFAVHMLWRNPLADQTPRGKGETLHMSTQDNVRVVTVQFQMRGISAKEQFAQQVEYFVDVASDYRADFVVFPELFTLELLSLEEKALSASESIERLSSYTAWFKEFCSNLSVSYNINIIAGSHPTKDDAGEMKNVCFVFLRDGSIHAQEKIHPTPNEAYWWNLKGGNTLNAINTDCGPIGVLICYDAEFPELARHLVDQGAMILFVPFCTDEQRGYLRVRYCGHARAIENQCYVVLSGVVGNLPNVENMDIHYAQSCIITPCDFAFARDGVAADTGANTETIALADLRLGDLRVARASGTVRNLKDRRFDLYRVAWGRRAATKV